MLEKSAKFHFGTNLGL